MADEAAASVVPSLGKLTYSLKQYLIYARLLQEKASRLNRGGQHHTLTVLPYTVESLIEDTSQWTLRRTLFCVEYVAEFYFFPFRRNFCIIYGSIARRFHCSYKVFDSDFRYNQTSSSGLASVCLYLRWRDGVECPRR